MRPRRRRMLLVALGSLAVLSGRPRADTVTIVPGKDNTLYESVDGSLSNGKGQYLFAGKTATSRRRRAVLEFDVACNVPAGATINGASLTLTMDMTISAETAVSLHRLDAEWGEGASDAAGPEGGGTAPAAGDATWIHRAFNTTFWTAPGGDFQATPSAFTIVDIPGIFTWSSAGMASDAQAWLDDPSSNHGWILIGDENTDSTAKRFLSKDHLTPEARPLLTLDFTAPANPSGSVPDGVHPAGTPLRVAKGAGGALDLTWGPSCACTDHDYEVYEGALGSFTTHTPVLCSTGSLTSATITPAAGQRYYLVVPHNGAREGSYGLRSNLLERPQGVSPCLPQETGACQ